MKLPSRRVQFSLLAMVAGLSITTSRAFALPFQQMIVFGDSLSDTGNDFLATSGLIPPPGAYGNGRFTDGSNSLPSTSILGVWHEQLAGKLGLPAAGPSLAGGTDYAFGGAETGVSSTYLGQTVPGMASQLQFFLTGKTSVPSNALYVFWGGSNNLFDAGSASALSAAAPQAISDLSAEIGTLASAGAKYFLWVDLPPLDKTPDLKNSPSQAALQAATIEFNTEFATAVPALESKYAGISITPVDVYGLFLDLLSNPSSHGLTNVTDPAQGNLTANPDTYLFWDGTHPTTVGHGLLADLAAQDLLNTFASNVPEPGSLSLLFLGLGTAGTLIIRRRILSRQSVNSAESPEGSRQ
jgi:phospholipase/lecithinase/hemolysin